MFGFVYSVIAILGVLFTLLWSTKTEDGKELENDDVVLLTLISFIPFVNAVYLLGLVLTFIVNTVRKE